MNPPPLGVGSVNYSEGSDTIADYSAAQGDEISIGAAWTAKNSGEDVIFTTDDGTLTVKKANMRL